MSDTPSVSPSDIDVWMWQPTQAQRTAKAKFWGHQSGSWRPAESLTVAEMSVISGVAGLKNWFQKPEFVAWFLNKDSVRQRFQAEAEIALDVLIDVMNSEVDPKNGATAAAKVKAAELILNYAGFKPTQHVAVSGGGKTLDGMDADKLREALQAQVSQLLSRMAPEQMAQVIGVENLAKLSAIPATPAMKE